MLNLVRHRSEEEVNRALSPRVDDTQCGVLLRIISTHVRRDTGLFIMQKLAQIFATSLALSPVHRWPQILNFLWTSCAFDPTSNAPSSSRRGGAVNDTTVENESVVVQRCWFIILAVLELLPEVVESTLTPLTIFERNAASDGLRSIILPKVMGIVDKALVPSIGLSVEVAKLAMKCLASWCSCTASTRYTHYPCSCSCRLHYTIPY